MGYILKCLEFDTLSIGNILHQPEKDEFVLQMSLTDSQVSITIPNGLSIQQPHNIQEYASSKIMMNSHTPAVTQSMSCSTSIGSTLSASPALQTIPNPSTPGPKTSMTPSIAYQKIAKVQNVVSTVNVGCELNLKYIALQALKSEYNPNQFIGFIMRIREPRTTALIFKSGKLVCTGSKNVNDSKLALRKYVRIIHKFNYPVVFQNFLVHNVVGSYDVKFPIRLEALVLSYSKFCSYEPELFPGLVYRMKKPNVVLLIFSTGKVVLTGAKLQRELNVALSNIYPILQQFEKKKLK